jgi:CP family cyanate transporter-like MFS transporter
MNRTRTASLVALFLAGVTLRPQIVGIGPLLPRIQDSLDVSHAVAGLLATIPILCMGVFATLAPPMLRRYGSRTAIGGALSLVGLFGIARAYAPGTAPILLLTVPIGIGIAVAGTLLPVVVKEEHSDRPTLGTGVYTAGINVAAMLSSVLAVPLALVIGWRGALATFAAASMFAVVPWIRGRHANVEPVQRSPLPWRLPLAWVIAAVFALQAVTFYGFNAWLADAYVERGWSEAAAGGLVALMNGVTLAGGIATAATADRIGSRRSFLLVGSTFTIAGAAPIAAGIPGAWLWAVLVGVSSGLLFTTAMTLPLDAAQRSGDVAALSTLMLGVGYALAALAPFVLGALRDATGGFRAPLIALTANAVLLFVVAATASLGPSATRESRRIGTASPPG